MQPTRPPRDPITLIPRGSPRTSRAPAPAPFGPPPLLDVRGAVDQAPAAAADPSRALAADLAARFAALERSRLDSWVRAAGWSLMGWLGRPFSRARPPRVVHPSGLHLLHLGAGARLFEGWVNADYCRPWQLLSRGPRPNWTVDLTRPLPCGDGVFDGVLLEHTNEHLTYSENLRLFAEVHRSLRPGGVLRVIVPSLTRYLAWDTERAHEPKLARFHSLPEALSYLTQNHAHRSVWDVALLSEVLSAVGFSEVTERKHRDSALAELAVDAPRHAWESVAVEGRAAQRLRLV